MNILITGGAGYIGSVLVGNLLNQGYRVTVADNFMYRQKSLLSYCKQENFEVACVDVRDRDKIKPFYKSADIIVPLAAIVGAKACDQDRQAAQDVNFEAVRHLLDNTSPAQKIILPTTNSGYGTSTGEVFCDEETPLNPISLYGVTKVNAEQELLSGSRGVSIRLATVFGMSPRMRIDLLVNDFVSRAFFDRFIVLFEADFKRNFISIHDVCRGIEFAIQNYDKMKGEAFNLGLSDANLSKKELCETIKNQLNEFYYHCAEIGSDPDKRNYIVSNEKIESLGFKCGTSLDQGIAELIKGYRMVRNGGDFDNIIP
mgnify:CR=1 FL=1